VSTNESAVPLPEYPPGQLTLLTLDNLIELLIAEEDRAPRNLIDECARRGEEMVDACARLAEDEDFWQDEITDGQWWLRLHAVMILGLIPGERAGAVLVSFMRRMEEVQDESLQDWLAGYWPALYRNKPGTVLPGLRALAQDRDVDWFVRVQALECVIAAAARAGGAELDAALDWAAGIAADETEDWDFRLCTGSDVLDFPRPRHRALLEQLAERQSGMGVHFTKAEIAQAYAAGRDDPEWARFDDPWKFYQPEAIAERQERWAREEAEELGAEDKGGFDEVPLPYVRATAKIGRNDPCPCGSGKKYKKCCLEKDGG